jgi:hypothetical protein
MESARSKLGSLISVERAFGLALAILSLVCIFDLHNATYLVFWDSSGPGPSWLPYVMAVILMILALFLIVPRSRTSASQLGASPAGTVKYIVLVLALAWAFPIIGGLLSLGLFVVIEMLWVEKQKWSTSVVVGLISTVVVWGIFAKLLGVALPTGPFGI